ncbi:MAG: hypothetical protein SNJ71_03215 [Bacteroidales bacterium]
MENELFTKEDIQNITSILLKNKYFKELCVEDKADIIKKTDDLINKLHNQQKISPLQVLEQRLKCLYPHKFMVEIIDTNRVHVKLEHVGEDYEDYLVRSLKEIYGYEAENNRFESGFEVKV